MFDTRTVGQHPAHGMWIQGAALRAHDVAGLTRPGTRPGGFPVARLTARLVAAVVALLLGGALPSPGVGQPREPRARVIAIRGDHIYLATSDSGAIPLPTV